MPSRSMIQMKAIIPKGFQGRAIDRELERAMELVVATVERDFQSTVQDWNEKPKVEKKVGRTRAGLQGVVWILNQVYYWLSEGTKDHRVPKTGTATMAFPTAYSAKTSPSRVPSRPGGASGNIIVRTGAWVVKGIKACKFDKQIKEKRDRLMWRLFHEALRRGARASGHGA